MWPAAIKIMAATTSQRRSNVLVPHTISGDMKHRRMAPNVISRPASRIDTDRPRATSLTIPAGPMMAIAVTRLPSISATAARRAFVVMRDQMQMAARTRKRAGGWGEKKKTNYEALATGGAFMSLNSTPPLALFSLDVSEIVISTASTGTLRFFTTAAVTS